MARNYRPYDPEQHRRRKYTLYLKSQGIDPFVSDERVRAHIVHLRTALSIEEIAVRAGLPMGTVQAHCEYGSNLTGKIRPANARAILAVQLGASDLNDEERLRGAQRALRGLMAMGFSTKVIALEMGLKSATSGARVNSLPNITQGSYTPGAEVYAALMRVAEKFETVNPLDLGMTSRGVNSVKVRGKLYPPVTAWDYDTIHLPDAMPDWTGECGTVQGARIHKREGIKMCAPCRKAAGEYERERRRGHKLG